MLKKKMVHSQNSEHDIANTRIKLNHKFNLPFFLLFWHFSLLSIPTLHSRNLHQRWHFNQHPAIGSATHYEIRENRFIHSVTVSFSWVFFCLERSRHHRRLPRCALLPKESVSIDYMCCGRNDNRGFLYKCDEWICVPGWRGPLLTSMPLQKQTNSGGKMEKCVFVYLLLAIKVLGMLQ
jgi:hypothetical protein